MEAACRSVSTDALPKSQTTSLTPNTEAKKKRTLTIQITFTPDEDDREDVSVDVATNVKLAPETGLSTQLWINKDFKSGEVSITEHAKGQIKGQLTLDELGMETKSENTEPPTAEELGCDPETGEVIEQEKSENKGIHRVVDMRKAMNR